MKSIKEKAEAYDEALGVALETYQTQPMYRDWLEKMFPELKESEDEKIKELIYNLLSIDTPSSREIFSIYGKSKEDVIAWLEKQGEKKPVVIISNFGVGDEIKTSNEESLTITKIDKKGYWSEDLFICSFEDSVKWELVRKLVDEVEPKFHEGEWLCENEPNNYARFIQILEIVNVQGKERYRISRDIHNDKDIVEFDFVEKYYHKFDIQDAKDGDVLATSAGAFIYNGNNGGGSCPGSYCGINTLGRFKTGVEHHWTGLPVSPATKEQRDTLMKAMADAGYTFDFKKKELKKIDNKEVNGEDYGIDILYHAQRILEKTLGKVDGYQSDDGILEHKCAISVVKKLYEQNPVWSEEDEKFINEIEESLLAYKIIVMDNDRELANYIEKEINWLNSIKDRVQPQLQWKPSEEQMKALSAINVTGGISYAGQGQTLIELYNDLKKLMEE